MLNFCKNVTFFWLRCIFATKVPPFCNRGVRKRAAMCNEPRKSMRFGIAANRTGRRTTNALSYPSSSNHAATQHARCKSKALEIGQNGDPQSVPKSVVWADLDALGRCSATCNANFTASHQLRKPPLRLHAGGRARRNSRSSMSATRPTRGPSRWRSGGAQSAALCHVPPARPQRLRRLLRKAAAAAGGPAAAARAARGPTIAPCAERRTAMNAPHNVRGSTSGPSGCNPQVGRTKSCPGM